MNEFDFIKRLRERSGRSVAGSSLLMSGIGDDAAVFSVGQGKQQIVTTDLLVEDIDFRLASTRPDLLGHKALAVSLSDIAAMGAAPRYSLLSIGLPEEIWRTDFPHRFYEGLFGLADRYEVTLIGGDISRSHEKIVIDSIAIGNCSSGKAVLRSTARPGDHIFVTGTLGGAAAGLRLMERGARLRGEATEDHETEIETQRINDLLLRQLRPEARVGWGILLGEQELATAMIDLSDGLSSDLNHLCDESGVGATIEASRLPIDPAVSELSGRRALDPLILALNGGEDFELLFTVKPENLARLPKRVDGVPVTYIGDIQERTAGVVLAEGQRRWPLEPGGWMHFNSEQ